MSILQTISLLIFLAALFAYVNGKFLKLAPAVGSCCRPSCSRSS